MVDVYDRIIEKIVTNRISTTEVADCLGKTGAMPDILPLTRPVDFKVGRVFLAYAYNGSNWDVHDQVRQVKKGDIVVVETHDCGDKAIFGELVSKYIMLYRQASGIVVNGYVRDAHRLIKERYPFWCKGVTPIGCHNSKNQMPLDRKIVQEWKNRYEGSIAVCDDGGVVIIPKSEVNPGFLRKLDFIELQEDIWNYCINTKKWSTFDTVCLKRYLKEPGLLPEELKGPFEKFLKEMERKKATEKKK